MTFYLVSERPTSNTQLFCLSESNKLHILAMKYFQSIVFCIILSKSFGHEIIESGLNRTSNSSHNLHQNDDTLVFAQVVSGNYANES